jgi:tetratricopeptide (TPR) repeat protein
MHAMPGNFGRTLLAAALFAYSLAAGADALTDRAQALLKRNDAKAAYDLLLPQEAQRAGDPEFDYLLGIAALDAGQPEHAAFALERVLAVQPGNLQARAEIARAYYVMGERDTAKREFESVRERGVPAEVRETIDRFLSAIEATRKTRFNAYVELAAGHDSNVNSATAQSQVAVPFFGGAIVQLAPGSTRLKDSFGSLSAGLSLANEIAANWSVVGSASFYGKYNADETRFNTGTLDGALGLRWSSGRNAVTGALQGQRYSVDGESFRESAGGVLQWQHNISQTSQVSLFAQHAQLSYPDPSQSIRDARRTIFGVATAQAFAGESAPVIFASLYGGEEKEDAPNVPHLGHKPVGVRVGGQWRVAPGVHLFANASAEQRRYGGTDPLFLVERKDTQVDLSLGLNYPIYRKLSLRPQVSVTDNNSNIEIYDFRRTVAQLGLRLDF